MATRTNATDVRVILENTAMQDGDLEQFVSIANLIVTEELVGRGLSDARLEQIEKFLTAHIITSTKERMAQTETLGNASIRYGGGGYIGASAAPLDFTPHGKMVKQLDVTGRLANLGNKRAYLKSIKTVHT